MNQKNATFRTPAADFYDEPVESEASLEKNEIYCELLVLRCRRGDGAAYRELAKMWERRLFYYLRRLTNDEQQAWDVLQQTWLRVLRGITTCGTRAGSSPGCTLSPGAPPPTACVSW